MTRRFRQEITLVVEWDERPYVTPPNTWNWTEMIDESVSVTSFEPVEEVTEEPQDDARILEYGVKYAIQYQIPGLHRVPRWGVAKFLGVELPDAGGTGTPTAYSFSGRPEFGTTSLKPESILHTHIVPESTPCYMDKREPPRVR